MLLMIDNYDSFTYNLVQYFQELGEKVTVKRNDEISVEEAKKLEFDYLVISPGPCTPDKAGISVPIIKEFAGKKPILGICLGHQSIAQAFGAKIIKASRIMHGKNDLITHDGKGVFDSLTTPLNVIRYHSLAVDKTTVPEKLKITAHSDDGEIMGLRHTEFAIEGLQFHPESIGASEGKKLLKNFLQNYQKKIDFKSILLKVSDRKCLSEREAVGAMELIASGQVSEAQISGLLTGLKMKGETIDEITGFAKVLRKKAVNVSLPADLNAVDTCGTGGDHSGTFNISTVATFVTNGAGAKIAKHGNRSATSKCGSADLLKALGAKIELTADQARQCFLETGLTFFFAPVYHPVFKYVVPVRKQLGFRTLFNIMGPLCNPAGVKRQVVGVFNPSITEIMAKVLAKLGGTDALIVHGQDGLDEITLTNNTIMTHLKNDWIKTSIFDPRDYGFSYCTAKDILGGDLEENKEICLNILDGKKSPQRDIVLINSSASLLVSGLVDDFKSGLRLAKSSIDSGKAKACMQNFIECSNSV